MACNNVYFHVDRGITTMIVDKIRANILRWLKHVIRKEDVEASKTDKGNIICRKYEEKDRKRGCWM